MATIHIQYIGEKVLVPQSELELLVEIAQRYEEITVQRQEDGVTTGDIMRLAEESGAFDFWQEKGEDIYSSEDFEYLVNKSANGEKGQYFTPRHVIDMCVQMLNPHLIVDHDLHNHGGELPDGIAEAFIEWAKSEKLSFWRFEKDSLDNKRRKAWENIVNNNRKRRLYVDPDIDISHLSDEMNDMEMEFNK